MKRPIIISLLVLLGLISIFVYIGQRNSLAKLTVNYKNTSGVSVVAVDDHQHGNEQDEEKDQPLPVKKSGDSLMLKKYKSYIVTYKGSAGYASDKVIVSSLSADKNITINPFYSDDTLSKRLAAESQLIHAALKKKYEKINVYAIQPGKLYRWGDWYGTTLVYSGPPTPHNDTLRVVLQKKNNSWEVASDPPNISLSEVAAPEVPLDVLNSVNRQATPVLKNKSGGGAVLRI